MMKQMNKLGKKGLMRHGIQGLHAAAASADPRNHEPRRQAWLSRFAWPAAAPRSARSISIVVADSRSPRDGRFIEKLGTYNPMLDKGHAERLTLKTERMQHWLERGALPTDRVARFLGDAGLAPKPEIRETPQEIGAQGQGARARQGARSRGGRGGEPARRRCRRAG